MERRGRRPSREAQFGFDSLTCADYFLNPLREWRSLVAYLVWNQVVAGANPASLISEWSHRHVYHR